MKALYLDCISGISGDMTVGALIDLGVKPSTLEWELNKLQLGEFHMHYERAKRKEIEGVKFDIHDGLTHTHDCEHDHEHEHAHAHSHEGQEKHECCDHDHGQAHSHEHSHAEQTHSHEHKHEHHDCCGHDHGDEKHDNAHAEHSHAHGDHDHDHECCDHDHDHSNTFKDIRELIETSELSPFVKKHAVGIFHRIAVAEGKIHGMPAEEVHFHEVGAFDSICDIVLACVGIESLGVEKVFVSRLNDGHGTVECAHGTFPVPAPATLEILKGIPLGQIDEPHELITPTGAAIAAEFAESFGDMPSMKIEKIGYGLGTRDLANRPNVLRAVIGELA